MSMGNRQGPIRTEAWGKRCRLGVRDVKRRSGAVCACGMWVVCVDGVCACVWVVCVWMVCVRVWGWYVGGVCVDGVCGVCVGGGWYVCVMCVMCGVCVGSVCVCVCLCVWSLYRKCYGYRQSSKGKKPGHLGTRGLGGDPAELSQA